MAYRKGVAAEQQLVRWLKDRKYETQRAAGSRGAADILAAKKGLLGLSQKKFAIQVKSTSGESFRILKADIKKLSEFSNRFDSIPMLAVRFSGDKWRFWSGETDDDLFDDSALKALENGKDPYAIIDVHSKKAKLFEKIL